MKRKINIAIDGYSSCGKSTLARDLAQNLDYIFIDTGAMYRAVTLYLLDNEIDLKDTEAIMQSMDKINLKLDYSGGIFSIAMNGKDVSKEIRQMRISNNVSEVATKADVRGKMVELQQKIGVEKGVVMDGRDIGSIVFPDAELKLFVTADPDIRAMRRFLELKERGENILLDSVKNNLLQRDHIDSTREIGPLTQVPEAIVIDTSYMTLEEQLYIATKLVEEKL